MKRSKKIALTLIASVSLATGGCGSDERVTKREVYRSYQECMEDWGDPEKCEYSKGIYYGPHYYYHGGRPYFFPKKSYAPVPVSDNIGFSRVKEGMRSKLSSNSVSSLHVVRGGFGRTSFFHGSS